MDTIIISWHLLRIVLNSIELYLDSSDFGVYLAASGICMSIMDHFNKSASRHFEKMLLFIFHKVRFFSLSVLVAIKLTLFIAILYCNYNGIDYIDVVQLYFYEYQNSITLFLSTVVFINAFILVVHCIDIWDENKVSAMGLLLTTVGFYYEMKDVSNFHYIIGFIAAFFVCMIFGKINIMYKEKSNLR